MRKEKKAIWRQNIFSPKKNRGPSNNMNHDYESSRLRIPRWTNASRLYRNLWWGLGDPQLRSTGACVRCSTCCKLILPGHATGVDWGSLTCENWHLTPRSITLTDPGITMSWTDTFGDRLTLSEALFLGPVRTHLHDWSWLLSPFCNRARAVGRLGPFWELGMMEYRREIMKSNCQYPLTCWHVTWKMISETLHEPNYPSSVSHLPHVFFTMWSWYI